MSAGARIAPRYRRHFFDHLRATRPAIRDGALNMTMERGAEAARTLIDMGILTVDMERTLQQAAWTKIGMDITHDRDSDLAHGFATVLREHEQDRADG